MTIQLRDARLADCEVVYRWNFAPDVRGWSKNPRAVSLAEHTRWYQQRLAGSNPTWIIENDGVPIGIVRLDPVASSNAAARISIALAAGARGRGIGRQAIELACARERRPVVAEVGSNNLASRRCFEACGFVLATADNALVTYRWSP